MVFILWCSSREYIPVPWILKDIYIYILFFCQLGSKLLGFRIPLVVDGRRTQKEFGYNDLKVDGTACLPIGL